VPFVPFNFVDHGADTSHLTYDEQGAYWSLLRLYYLNGPFDNDMKSLKRLTRCPNEKETELKNILGEFFSVSDDCCWHHKRCDEEIMRIKKTSEVQSKKARQGIESRERHSNGQFATKSEESVINYLPATAGDSPAIKSNNEYQDEYQEEYKY
jgi:uncharacterized protein YdaU (DUF1376 family)